MTYEIRTTDRTIGYPGCERRDATCATLAEAEAAVASLVATGEWSEDDLEIVRVADALPVYAVRLDDDDDHDHDEDEDDDHRCSIMCVLEDGHDGPCRSEPDPDSQLDARRERADFDDDCEDVVDDDVVDDEDVAEGDDYVDAADLDPVY